MTAILGWIVRVLVILMILRIVSRWIWPLPPRQTGRVKARTRERLGGRLVRDPHCGTYLPVERAIRVGSGDAALHFCSTACRDAHRAAHSSVA